MEQFEYGRILQGLMTPRVVSALCGVHEHRGRQRMYAQTQPQELLNLCEVAKIQSTGASNRIENISTTEKRLREIVVEDVQPRNRDEREIAGYRYVLDEIHQSHDDIPVTPNVILQLHRDLYRYLDVLHAGRYKDADNLIAERVDGKLVARFRPTSAVATPSAAERICNEYKVQIDSGEFDPLLVSLVFVFDFVSIHPFNDGNGRMSRLLTLLLMYKNGYTIGKYISIEAEIELSKETYYEALSASSPGWERGESNYEPFVLYMLGVVAACCAKLDKRMDIVSTSGSNEEVVRAYFESLVSPVNKREIMDDNPGLSQRTIERILGRLQEEGLVEKTGAARSTRYRRAR